MGSRYHFRLATPADDAALRGILAETPMDGVISLSLRREPSYFAAAEVEGPFHQCLVADDERGGRPVACGWRSVRLRYLDGRPVAVGYLGGLRILRGHRRGQVLARGFGYLRQLHGDARTQLYVTTIAEGNDVAGKALAADRAGLPHYTAAGIYHTAALPIGRHWRKADSCEVRSASEADLPLVLDFLLRAGEGRQFFPCYTPADFGPGGSLRGLRPADLLLAFRGRQLSGVLGAWDQRGFRQEVVHAYRWPLGLLRPLYNLARGLRGAPALPAPGEALQCVAAALPVIADDDPEVFACLLAQQLRALRGRADYLLVGMHESDPLLPALRRFAATWYPTRLYIVHWDEAPPAFDRSRPIYLELGSL